MGTVKIRTQWTILDPLEDVPKSEWRSVVLSRGHWIANALDYRLSKALDLLHEIERHEAWTATGMDRVNFLRFVCSIEAADLPRIREGYRILQQRGKTPTSRQEALQARAEAAQQLGQTVPAKGLRPNNRIDWGSGVAFRVMTVPGLDTEACHACECSTCIASVPKGQHGGDRRSRAFKDQGIPRLCGNPEKSLAIRG